MLNHAAKIGYKPMLEDGIGKVLAGITDIDELASTINITERLREIEVEEQKVNNSRKPETDV
jgi:hypothetical protein